MSGFLLDTNILSEIRKQRHCDPGVRAWIEQTEPGGLFLSVLVLGEIRQGLERIQARDRLQARVLEKWLVSLLNDFADRILPVDESIADQWGRLGVSRPVPVIDALIASTALVHDLTVVSRDEDGFRTTGVRFVNPFSRP